MPNDFLNISEATLWDNLKRKANETLRKLEGIEDKTDLLKEFNPQLRPDKIQKLLEDTGKSFYKLFLYKAIRKSFNDNDIKNHSVEIYDFVKSFRFYYWPGYTTLNKDRIHIRGCKKYGDSDDRFFTGIGNTFTELKDFSLLSQFIGKYSGEVNNGSFDYSGNFWIKNIPSTVAFDSLLNQFYINKEFGEGCFEVPSTHYWKSSQVRRNGDFGFIPMPLRKDNSELRILQVSIGPQSVQYGENRIAIKIDPNYLNQSGFQLYNYLKQSAIKINWQRKEDQNDYIEWPFTAIQPIQVNSKLASYSYWLSETLDNEKYCVLDYANIRDAFDSDGIGIVSKNIVPFHKFKKRFFQKEKLIEIYYKYWTTIYLESYSVNADLGTAMFLTSYEYDSNFLMKCSNWLRWLYNELRLLEATAIEQIVTKKTTRIQEFQDLKHDLDTIISAQNYFVDDYLSNWLSKVQNESIKYYTSTIRSLIKLRGTGYAIKESKIDLEEEIELMISSFKILCDNIFRFNLTFGLSLEEDRFFNYQQMRFLNYNVSKIFVNSNKSLLRLIFKDLIENLIKHSNTLNPECEISCVEEDENAVVIFLNSKWPTDEIISKMQNNSFEQQKRGWRRINELLNNSSTKINLPKNKSDRKYDDLFWIELKIPLYD